MITTKQILDKVIELAEANPDNSYIKDKEELTCYYTKGTCTNGTQGCIVGQTLMALGVKKEELEVFDDPGVGFVISAKSVIRKLFDYSGVDPNLDILDSIQSMQDMGLGWGECIRGIRN